MPLSTMCASTGACTRVPHATHAHLPRMWRSTVKRPGGSRASRPRPRRCGASGSCRHRWASRVRGGSRCAAAWGGSGMDRPCPMHASAAIGACADSAGSECSDHTAVSQPLRWQPEHQRGERCAARHAPARWFDAALGIQRWTGLAFMPLSKATPATETSGSRQAATADRLSASLCVRRTRRAMTTSIVSTVKIDGHGLQQAKRMGEGGLAWCFPFLRA